MPRNRVFPTMRAMVTQEVIWVPVNFSSGLVKRLIVHVRLLQVHAISPGQVAPAGEFDSCWMKRQKNRASIFSCRGKGQRARRVLSGR
jgi:hypothetical protein